MSDSFDKIDDESTIKELKTELDEDEDEITQDWSQLAKLAKKSLKSTIPKRGEKEYGPDGTNVQENLLFNARKAMFETLFNSIRGSTLKNQVKAYYVKEKHEAVVLTPKGNFLQTVGKVDKLGKCWIHFIEFLYLAERGTITPYLYNDNIITENDEDHIPLSIEDIYSFFHSQREMDNFFVYAHLKRLGFIVYSSDNTYSDKTSYYPPDIHVKKGHPIKYIQSLFTQLQSRYIYSTNSIFNGIFYCDWNFKTFKYRSSASIYLGLNKLIPYVSIPKAGKELYEAKQQINDEIGTSTTSKNIQFDVWKPQTNFKKKSPGLPDYQVVVFNKGDKDQHFPTYEEAHNIFNSLDYKFEFLDEIDDDLEWNKHSYTNNILRVDYLSKLKSKAQQMRSSTGSNQQTTKKKRSISSYPLHSQQVMKLKNGYRSFLLAVIDDGLVSFIKLSEADFGIANVWYNPPLTHKSRRNIKIAQSNRDKQIHCIH